MKNRITSYYMLLKTLTNNPLLRIRLMLFYIIVLSLVVFSIKIWFTAFSNPEMTQTEILIQCFNEFFLFK